MNFVIKKNKLIFKNDKQSSYKCDELFLNIKEKDYDIIFHIDLSKIEIEGNLWKELYRFKNLKTIDIGIYDYHTNYTMYEFEYLYNNNVKLVDNFGKYYLKDIFEFYKIHQDDPYYKNELFEAGLNDVDFNNVDHLYSICRGYFDNKNVNLSELIKITFDSFHKKDDDALIFKNKFGEFYNIYYKV